MDEKNESGGDTKQYGWNLQKLGEMDKLEVPKEEQKKLSLGYQNTLVSIFLRVNFESFFIYLGLSQKSVFFNRLSSFFQCF